MRTNPQKASLSFLCFWIAKPKLTTMSYETLAWSQSLLTKCCVANYRQNFTSLHLVRWWTKQHYASSTSDSSVPWTDRDAGQQTWQVSVLLLPGRADERQHSTFVCKYPRSGSPSQSHLQAQQLLDSYHPGFQVGTQNTEGKGYWDA